MRALAFVVVSLLLFALVATEVRHFLAVESFIINEKYKSFFLSKNIFKNI
jgi:hypothetical protein